MFRENYLFRHHGREIDAIHYTNYIKVGVEWIGGKPALAMKRNESEFNDFLRSFQRFAVGGERQFAKCDVTFA